jgi:hypothetical protein
MEIFLVLACVAELAMIAIVRMQIQYRIDGMN